MKNLLFIIIVIMIFSCSQTKEEPLLEPLTLNEISGERLWERISEESDYRDYNQWSGHEGLRPGQSPHGSLHSVYINRTLFDAVPLADSIAPYGSIIVKENYTPSGDFDKYTVMVKVEGYSPETQDWFWAAFSADGTPLVEGSPNGCVSCHEGRRGNDFMIIKSIDEAN